MSAEDGIGLAEVRGPSRRAAFIPSVLTAIAFAGLERAGLVGQLPTPLLLGLLAVAAIVGEFSGRRLARPLGTLGLYTVMGLQVLGVALIVYAIGWGPTLAIGYLFVVARALEVGGSRVWKPAVVWIGVATAAGQVAIELGLVSTYVRTPYVHALAFLSVLGVAFVGQVLGHKTAEQERANAELRAGEARFRQLFADNPQPMWVYDRETLRFLEVNEAAIRSYGYSRDEFRALRITDIRPEEDVPKLLANIENRADELEETSGWRHRRADGTIIDVEISSHRLTLDHRPAILVAVQDVTQRNAAESQLRYQATHDSLTGASTRAALLSHTTELVSSADWSTACLGLVVIDIDQFKLVNDSLGAEHADALLRLIVERLKRRLGPNEMLARLGSDDFAAVLVAGSYEQLYDDAESLREALTTPFSVASQPLYVSASAGLAIAREPAPPAELLRRADNAMHRAKSRGRNRLDVFDEDEQLGPGTRLALARDLRSMLQRGRLNVHYQPIIELATNRIVGVEALARCERPVSLPPSVFIPLAEELGLIGVLGEQILALSVGEASRWPELRLAVNVAPRQLLDPGLPDQILNLLRIADMDPRRLVLEVTETVLVEDSALTTRTLSRLVDEGISLAIDDFGSGYAGLQYLQRFPVSELKIDRSLVDHLDEQPQRAAVTRAVVEMAKELGIDVVAEGVEREAERSVLVGLGCTYAQGYLFAAPMPGPELARWVDGWLAAPSVEDETVGQPRVAEAVGTS